jgi:hypothetical protein
MQHSTVMRTAGCRPTAYTFGVTGLLQPTSDLKVLLCNTGYIDILNL